VLVFDLRAEGRDVEGRWGLAGELGEADHVRVTFRLLEASAAAQLRSESDWLGEIELARRHFGEFGGEDDDRSAMTFQSMISLP